jgi:hypothetical protein
MTFWARKLVIVASIFAIEAASAATSAATSATSSDTTSDTTSAANHVALATKLAAQLQKNSIHSQLAISLLAHSERVASLDATLRGALVAMRVVQIQAKKALAAESAKVIWIDDRELDRLAGIALEIAQDAYKSVPHSQL